MLNEILTNPVGVVAHIEHGSAGLPVTRLSELSIANRIMALASGQNEVKRIAVCIDLDVDFGGEATAAAAKALRCLSPLRMGSTSWLNALHTHSCIGNGDIVLRLDDGSRMN